MFLKKKNYFFIFFNFLLLNWFSVQVSSKSVVHQHLPIINFSTQQLPNVFCKSWYLSRIVHKLIFEQSLKTQWFCQVSHNSMHLLKCSSCDQQKLIFFISTHCLNRLSITVLFEWTSDYNLQFDIQSQTVLIKRNVIFL